MEDQPLDLSISGFVRDRTANDLTTIRSYNELYTPSSPDTEFVNDPSDLNTTLRANWGVPSNSTLNTTAEDESSSLPPLLDSSGSSLSDGLVHDNSRPIPSPPFSEISDSDSDGDLVASAEARIHVDNYLALFQREHRKFERACDQMAVLDRYTSVLRGRILRAVQRNNRTAATMLKQKASVAHGVRMMFFYYAEQRAVSMEVLREKMEAIQAELEGHNSGELDWWSLSIV